MMYAKNRELRYVVRKDSRQVIFKLHVNRKNRLLEVKYSVKKEGYMQMF